MALQEISHHHLIDARRDPTQTGKLRARFRGEVDRRWQVLARTLRQALIEHDLVGLRGMHKLPAIDKTEGFSLWLAEELRQKVFGLDGRWLRPFVQEAANAAQSRAAILTTPGQVDPQKIAAMQALAVSELRGIIAAAQQQLVRVITQCLMAGSKPHKAANAASAVVRNMRGRTRDMAEYLVAKTHATASLSAFRSAGITHVGVDPEHIKRTPHGKVLVDVGPPDEPRDPHGRWTSGSGGDDQTSTAQFKAWFKNSKVVDENGNPLVVYRGDRANKTSFGGGKDTRIVGNIFFSDNPSVAKGYTPNYRENFYAPTEELNESHGLYKVFLSLQNPLIADADNNDWGEVPVPRELGADAETLQIDELAVLARKKGYDGLVVRNVLDQWGDGTQYVAFEPTQIKSALGSKFSPDKPGIKDAVVDRDIEEGEDVDVITAGDNLVCEVCEDISLDGPYELDEAEGLIPAHNRCRCAFVPLADRRFAQIERDARWWFDYNPYHQPGGSPEGGQFASAGWGGEPLVGSQGDPALVSTALTTATPRAKDELDKVRKESFSYQRVDLAQLQKDPETFAKAVDKFRDGETFPYLRESDFNGDDNHDARVIVDRIKSNLEVMWNDTPKEERERDRHWYGGAHALVGDRMNDYPVGRPAMTGMYAALSPNTQWDVNVHLGDRILDTVFHHGDDPFDKDMAAAAKKQLDIAKKAATTEKRLKNYRSNQKLFRETQRAGSYNSQVDDEHRAAWIKLWNDAHDDSPVLHVGIDGGMGAPIKNKGVDDNGDPTDMSGKFGPLDRIENALHALRSNGNTKEISDALGVKHKVRSFYNNILDPHSLNLDVTIDTHAAGAGWLDPLGAKNEVLKQMFSGPPHSTRYGIMGTYPFYADAYREFARDHGLKPRELQSILWEHKIELFKNTPKIKKELIGRVWRHFHDDPSVTLAQAQQRVMRIAKSAYDPVARKRRAKDGQFDYQTDEAGEYSFDGRELSRPQLDGRAAAFDRGGVVGTADGTGRPRRGFDAQTLGSLVSTTSQVEKPTKEAAGVMFRTKSGHMLLMKRRDTGEWSIPAGHLEGRETPLHGAQREAAEETGYPGNSRAYKLHEATTRGVRFHTFVQPSEWQFKPILNPEHTQHGWFTPRRLPKPLHPGLVATLHAMSEGGGAVDAIARMQQDRFFDPELHPRGKSGPGTNEGSFTSGGGAAGGAKPDDPMVARATSGREVHLNPEVLDVGGTAWNKQVAHRLEYEYEYVKPDLDKLAAKITGTAVEPQHPDDEDEEAPFLPEEWDQLSNDIQSDIEDKWMEDTQNEFYDSEVTTWHESGQSMDDATLSLVYDFDKAKKDEWPDWAKDAVDEVLSGNEEDGHPIPFTADQILKATSIKFDPSGEGWALPDDKHAGEWKKKYAPEIEIDPTKTGFPIGWESGLPPGWEAGGHADPTLPGIEPEKPPRSPLIKEDAQNEITGALLEALHKEAHDMNVDPPDYLSDNAKESQEQYWGEMSDEDKLAWAKDNTDLIPTDETPEGSSITMPTKFNPFGNSDKSGQDMEGPQYKMLGALARKMSIERAAELILQRGGGGVPKGEPPINLDAARHIARDLDSELWSGWKASSTGVNGSLLQLAIAEELHGRLNKNQLPYSVESMKYTAKQSFGGYENVKAYLRAKWETTQWMLDKAGAQTVQMYRGLRGMSEEQTGKPVDVVTPRRPYYSLPDLDLKRNGAASTSTNPDIANNWGHTVMRIEAPRTAVLSVPVYGQNVYGEQETIVTGTALKGWDAWQSPAPPFSAVPIGHKTPKEAPLL